MMPMFRLKPLAAFCCACLLTYTNTVNAEETNNEVPNPYQSYIEKGLGYLLAQQRPDGSWGEGKAVIPVTTTVVDTLHHHHIQSIEFQRAVIWLANHSAEDAATLARQIEILTKTTATPYSLINKLKALRRTVPFKVGDKWQDAYTWSVKPHFQATIIDTALASIAMMATGIYGETAASRFYAYSFQALQHTDVPGNFTSSRGHGWGYADIFHGKKTPEKVIPTAYATRFLHSVITKYKTAEDKEKYYLPGYGNYAKYGALWLASHQQSSGAITDTLNLAIYETAEALLTLQAFKEFYPEPLLFADTLKKGRDYLIQHIQSNGSWQDDLLLTALVVKVLDSEGVNLTNNDYDGLPDSLESFVGRDPNRFDPPIIYQPNTSGIIQTRLKMVNVLAGSSLPTLDALGGKVVRVVSEPPTTANGLLTQTGLYMRVYIVELADGSQQVVSVPIYVSSPDADNDNDYMLARFEALHHLNDFNPADALDDADTDGLTHVEEFWSATLPFADDSDNDQMPDGFEVYYRLNPNNAEDAKHDPDNDQLSNLMEYQWQSNPRVADTDNDGVQDGEEVKQKRHPAVHEPALQIVLDYLL
ncbi:prenyltransferase/squalene oxidase repeat-containing protein [Spartinivicinus ruber]|uniref:prenyltransferase/squalene oxidase repeat-containing protein n=1 Tax=Spartinivicinus ruber TaxID=2683272 RepID=UPI0013D2B336|nr:prenyltransferase/squalene oxidase repeat-containing protein [Spartinivicinus ruber]